MAEHIIPNTEEDLHIQTEDCVCYPKFILDNENGEMVWQHNILDWDRLIVDIIKI